MFCRFCGKEVPADSVFCMYCGKNLGDSAIAEDALSRGDSLSDIDGIFKDAVADKRRADAERKAKCERARAFVRTGRYDSAIAEYLELVDLDPTLPTGYIGIVRVTSKNYSCFDGSYSVKAENGEVTVYTVAGAMKNVDIILEGRDPKDPEYEKFLSDRAAFIKSEEERKVREAKEAEERRIREAKEAEERRIREAKEAEERKAREARELLDRKKADLEQKIAAITGDAYSSFNNLTFLMELITLSKELSVTLSDGVMKRFEQLFRHSSSGQMSSYLNNYIIKSYFTERAKEGNISARFCLIFMKREAFHIYKDGVTDDPYLYEAISEYEALAKLGNVSAMYELGRYYYSGGHDAYKGRNYLLSGANKGDRECISMLAGYYKNQRDFYTAEKWYLKIDAFYYIANMWDREGDVDRAVKYYKKCLENGNENLYVSKRLSELLCGNS